MKLLPATSVQTIDAQLELARKLDVEEAYEAAMNGIEKTLIKHGIRKTMGHQNFNYAQLIAGWAFIQGVSAGIRRAERGDNSE